MDKGTNRKTKFRMQHMKYGRCSRYFTKMFEPSTIVDQDGYLLYKRRDNRNLIDKSGIFLDNHYVVPYNPKLLLKYKAHLNIEWCNQSTSIKYLLKYIHKHGCQTLESTRRLLRV